MIYLLSNPVTPVMERALIILHDLFAGLSLPAIVSPYALAIIVIAVAVKLVTYPLTATQQRSMQGMQAIQPKMKALQEEHKDDREALAQKQMELYKEHGVNPLGGCLPLIIQMVVLFGLYRAVMNLATGTANGPSMDGERFLWIPNLAACEPSPVCGTDTSVLPFAIPILVIVMVISQVFYQRMMTPPTSSNDPQAQAMASTMKMMPFIFAFIFLKLPSGLVLYYTLFNIVSVIQQKMLTPQLAIVPAEAGAAEDGPTSKSQERKRDERQRQQQRRKKGR
ncbi:MAG: membrane protein insertase YidC [Caldilineae bacterium]|nr:membrane protein insertase YidC [Chloroflexota bacterium]MCB9177775.1 membrane protein insertase YidC [Caldilineae bacterium]